MAKLSLREVTQSQLDSTPIVDGQMIVCKDTGNMYRDFGKTRVQTGRDIRGSSGGAAACADQWENLRLCATGEMWAYENGTWTSMNPEPERITNTQIERF
mgnify:CR=1 FL=1